MLKYFEVRYLRVIIFTLRMNHFCIKTENFSTLFCSMVIQCQCSNPLQYIMKSIDKSIDKVA